ncbi:MAG: chorismate mutase [Clostridia bacterium]|nr:chorismate mutase [Clostridia bacterium]
MNLDTLRTEIDEIDRQLVDLFCRRMDVSRRVAEYKKANGLPVYVPAREQAILEKLGNLAGEDFGPSVQALYGHIFEISRAYQHRRNGTRPVCGLLGRKLGHSYSPTIHRDLGDYAYDLFEKEPEELESFLKEGHFSGLNVTIPYKKTVIPHLDALSPTAEKLGAVNTIVRRPDSTLWGHNTDYFGFRSMVLEGGFAVAGKKCLVLGSGGASNTAVAVLEELGAEVVVISRSGENNYENLDRHADAAFIINATPVGMAPNTGVSPVDLRLFPRLNGVLDLIYNPARTRLLLDAESLGIPAMNGLWMLVAQAKEAAEHFTGCDIPNAVIPAIYKKLRLQMENILLIGMPGCGKSTVGRLLAEKLGKTFVDADAEIEKLAAKPIPAIFEDEGEEGFRRYESAVLADLGKRSGLVVATGGGCITRPENYPFLHQNGTIFRLHRDLDRLPTEGRPLSQAGKLAEMFAVRDPLYAAFADHTIDNNGTLDDTITQILKILEAN